MSDDIETDFVHLLARFEKRLISAKSHFEESEHGGRLGAIEAISAAMEFVMGIDRFKKQDLARPLAMLVGALHDLDDGTQAPLLTPKVFGNRPPDSSAVQAVCAYAAWTMDRLMQLGSKRLEAAAKVANTLTAAGFSFGQYKGSPPNTVASWRERLMRGKGRPFEASVWQDLQDNMLQFGTDNQSVLQRELLQTLEHLTRAARTDNSK